MDLKIFIITHKISPIPVIKNYEALFVGAADFPENRIPDNYITDNIGINISKKNNSYCELTGLYWIWKNVKNEYVGLVHYRRFFCITPGFIYNSRHFIPNNKNPYKILDTEKIENILQKADVIVKHSIKYQKGNANTFISNSHVGKENWESLHHIIKVKHPEYYDTFTWYSQQKRHFNCNMFIGKKSIIDSYCEWLFKILDEMDEAKFEKTGSNYRNREMGYFAEFLFGVWLYKNNIQVYISDVINIDGGDIDDGIMRYKDFPRYFLKSLIPREKRLTIRKKFPFLFR